MNTVFINEWLPNPAGSDASGEFIELRNSGNDAVNLIGWQIKTASGSKFGLSGDIGPGGYLVLPRSRTRLVLKNSEEKLFLYDRSGKLIDESGFLGSAPEGKSFSRVNSGEIFTWSEPTPGVANKISAAALAKNDYPYGMPINEPLDSAGFAGLLFGVAVLLTAVALFTIKTNENLSKLIFPRDEVIR